MAKPRAMAPLIMPAYERKTHSLNLRERSAPKSTNVYCTSKTETMRAKTIRTSSIPMKVTDHCCLGLLKMPKPIYEKISASAKYPSVWNVTALTDLP